MEKLAYLVKHRYPGLFVWIERCARVITVARCGARTRRALKKATLQGVVAGQSAVMRPLTLEDVDSLATFLETMPEGHLRFFHPHRFDRSVLRQVVGSRAFMTYGLFVEDKLVAYALLKISPTGSAFIGRLVQPGWAGCGIGRFIASFLYWQGSLAGLRVRSTVSADNQASLRSHQAVAEYRVIAQLPNDYMLIEFPQTTVERPALDL